MGCSKCEGTKKLFGEFFKVCVDDCPAGFFPSADGKKCNRCSDNCATCKDRPNNCDTCASGLVKKPVVVNNVENNVCFCNGFVGCSVSDDLSKLHCDFDANIFLSWNAISTSFANGNVAQSLTIDEVNSGYNTASTNQVPNTANL